MSILVLNSEAQLKAGAGQKTPTGLKIQCFWGQSLGSGLDRKQSYPSLSQVAIALQIVSVVNDWPELASLQPACLDYLMS